MEARSEEKPRTVTHEVSEEPKLSVSVSYSGMKMDFSGQADEVMKSVNDFVSKSVPAFQLARKLVLNFSATELVEKFGEFVRLTPEGPKVWRENQDLSDKELVGLQLVAQRIGYETASLTGIRKDSMSLSEIQEAIALNSKSISSRLSELTKAGYVVRETSGDEARFRITTKGIDWLANTLLKKRGKAQPR
jgi:predicted transcriptional regulator